MDSCPLYLALNPRTNAGKDKSCQVMSSLSASGTGIFLSFRLLLAPRPACAPCPSSPLQLFAGLVHLLPSGLGLGSPSNAARTTAAAKASFVERGSFLKKGSSILPRFLCN